MGNIITNLIPLNTLLNHKDIPYIIPLYHTTGFSHSLPPTRFLYRNRTEKEFENDLDFLLKNFTPIDLETLHIYVAQNKKTVKPYFHITIDDGLSSNYEIMAPVLLKKGIPASFFINPGFVGEIEIMHRYKVSLLLDSLESNKDLVIVASNFLNINNDLNNIKKSLLGLNYTHHDKLNKLIELLGSSWNELLNGNPLYMDMTQIGKLNENGFTLGAHTWDHPELHLLSLDNQKEQIEKSLDWIEQYFPQKIKAFAFPFTDHGISKDLFNWLGIQVDLSFGTAGLKKDVYNNHLQRIPVEKYSEYMSTILKTAGFKYWINKFAGKSVVQH